MPKVLSTSIFSNRQAYFDRNGKPLAFGRLAVYNAESSTSLAHVFNDAALTRMLENPVVLDSAGRAPALFSSMPVYVRVEKFAGRDEHGESLYELAYDYETPPGLDISDFYAVNFVDYYYELRMVPNDKPTFVLKEGDSHLYFWNPHKPSGSGLNEVTDIGSSENPDGSWHWETKRVCADQCGIRNDGTRHDVSRWAVFAALSMQGYETAVPRGTYDFFNASVADLSFSNLSIAPNVVFRNAANLGISVAGKAECLSKSLQQQSQLDQSKGH
ncbi:MAG: hypothetical protein LBH25_09555 [Fibromonadaceae bacterium]|jgi:hypothetical protein|nr:hypothetical protein [Fibromonadaceae bacterium]